jgi:hypothetical protein
MKPTSGDEPSEIERSTRSIVPAGLQPLIVSTFVLVPVGF